MTDTIMDTPVEGMLAQAGTENITLWSESKKKDFTTTFAQRVEVARYILEKSANLIARKAAKNRYVSDKHLGQFGEDIALFPDGRDDLDRARDSSHVIGGRAERDLYRIAGERADTVLSSLPPIRDAVLVIAPEVSAMMDEVQLLLARGQQLTDELNKVTTTIVLSELDPTTTIGEFLAMVKEREDRRKELCSELEEVAEKGNRLDSAVARQLYAGLPGLSDAVCKVIRNHLDRSTALDTMGRRVTEQVMFGDSAVALDLLRTFEKDELAVTTEVEAEFIAAMDTLRAAAKAGKKLAKPTTRRS